MNNFVGSLLKQLTSKDTWKRVSSLSIGRFPGDFSHLRKPLYVFQKEDYLPLALTLIIGALVFIFGCILLSRFVL